MHGLPRLVPHTSALVRAASSDKHTKEHDISAYWPQRTERRADSQVREREAAEKRERPSDKHRKGSAKRNVRNSLNSVPRTTNTLNSQTASARSHRQAPPTPPTRSRGPSGPAPPNLHDFRASVGQSLPADLSGVPAHLQSQAHHLAAHANRWARRREQGNGLGGGR